MTRRLLIAILALVPAVVHAQPTPPEPDSAPVAPVAPPRPWADGVSDAEQAVAMQLHEQGNADFFESRFAEALAKYRDAITHWDHPSIRFNMAVCLINLGQPIEARDNLERALAYGAAALGDNVHQQALTYRKLLDGQLIRITIRCQEPGAEVSLDGKHLFTAPGEAAPYLLPGDHQIVATKPGFLTASEPLELDPGTTATFDVRLVAFKSATTMVRRWARWKPYAVLAAGGAAAAIGGLVYAASSSNFAAYDDRVRAACPAGCTAGELEPLTDLRATKDRAELEQTIAITLFVAGGAALATAALGLYLNQPQAVLGATRPTPSIEPVPGGATVGVRWGF